jgi:hypothetical protein
MVSAAGNPLIPDTFPRSIEAVTHPEYLDNFILWEKWRLAYGGGLPLITRYLKQFSTREDTKDFESRKELTYVPAFAKQAVDEVKYGVAQRLCDTVRIGGPDTYQRAARGELGGVDLMDSTMNGFVSKDVLTELLVKGKVGIYVDMPQLEGVTLADKGDKHPYLQIYWAEDIRSWIYDDQFRGTRFKQLLLREWSHFTDPVSGLPLTWSERYKYLFVNPDDGYVWVIYYNHAGTPIDIRGVEQKVITPMRLGIREIPFVVGQLDHSMMVDIADYEIAMMNMASADVDFCVKANYPFYTEQRDTRVGSDHLRPTDNSLPNAVPPADLQGVVQKAQAEQIAAVTSTTPTVRTGVSYGRRYGYGLDRPGFIHPSSEPLKASMEKQTQMKSEIRELVHLSVARLDPSKASAESKMQDQSALENGLAVIGHELEKMERRIAYFWSKYEGIREVATIKYPTNYSLTTDDERRKAAKELAEQLPVVPSQTFQKEIAKQIAVKLLAHKIPTEAMDKIKSEIDKAQAMTTDSETIVQDLINGLVSLETASKLRGYGPGEAEKAKADHAERLARIADAQAANQNNPASRGLKDQSGNPTKDASAEKANSRDTTAEETTEDKTRGKGKNK